MDIRFYSGETCLTEPDIFHGKENEYESPQKIFCNVKLKGRQQASFIDCGLFALLSFLTPGMNIEAVPDIFVLDSD